MKTPEQLFTANRQQKDITLFSMYLFLLTLTFLLYPLHPIQAQPLRIDWQQCFGGSKKEIAYGITSFGSGYKIIGSTSSIDGDISYNHGGGDYWVVQIDSVGNLLWEKTYGGSSGEAWANGFQASESNDIYLVGGSNSSDGDISYDPYPDNRNFWVVKIDSAGNIIWDRILGNAVGYAYDLTGTSSNDGGVVATGNITSGGGDISNYYGGYDVWVIKLNSSGDTEWDFTIGSSYLEFVNVVIPTNDNGFLVGAYGKPNGIGGNIDCQVYSSNGPDAILFKLDANGNEEWQQCYGGSGHEGISGLLELEDGYIISAFGGSTDGDLEGSGWHGDNDIWIVRIDLFGNIIWQKCYGGSGSENARKIFQTDDGGFMVFGYTQSFNGDVSGNPSLNGNTPTIWVFKINSTGELLWQQCIGGINDERVHFGVIKKSDYNYVIAGEMDYSPSFDVDCSGHVNNGEPDFWVFEVTDTTVVDIKEATQTRGLKAYPNPATNYVIFELPAISSPLAVISTPSAVALAKAESVEKSPKNNPQNPPQITITNTLGQQVAQLEVKDSKTVLDTRDFKPGVYFYFLEIEGKRYSGKVVIQK